ncbi:PREDICTED: GTPase IMAP family member 2 [Rhinopithecus bieti]|uniref:GTPase, IMAP family member 2 n=2 Tax=Rhinopithecus TaxID=542827 RepID=A0A2K6LD19_RHIBE|nr:PREDICTED: GTPase IMAP family member 2 [Rhinopithecus bieti]
MITGLNREPTISLDSKSGTPMDQNEHNHWGSHAKGQCASRSELRIILVGKTGAGKSAAGNSILRKQAFESKLSSRTLTKTCSKSQGSWGGREIVIIDTPDMFSWKDHCEALYKEVQRCYLLSVPGPHVLLLVTQLGRYTSQDQEAAQRVKEIFGEDAMGHTIVLFTHKEDLSGGSLMDYMRNSDNKALSKLVAACGGRICAFNNHAEGRNQDDQVKELMDLIEDLLMEKNGEHYTNGLYSLIQRSKCGSVGSDQKLKEFKESLIKYMETQRSYIALAEANSLKRALIKTQLCVLFCIQLCLRLLILSLCVLHSMCTLFCCLLFSMCNLLCSLLFIIPKKLMIFSRTVIRLERRTPRL